jgi:hypothetical protein
VRLPFDSIAHRFEAGSRVRLSISPCLWPLAWPSPEPVRLTVHHGTGSALVLPVRPPRREDATMRPLDGPAEPEPLVYEHLAPGSGGGRNVVRDLASGETRLVFDWDCGGRSRLANGIEYEDTSVVTYAIRDDDPLSARVEVDNTSSMGRDDWRVDIVSTGRMTCTATHFETVSELAVTENGEPVFSRTWTHRFARDHG